MKETRAEVILLPFACLRHPGNGIAAEVIYCVPPL